MDRDGWVVEKADFTEEALARNNSIFTVCNGYFSLKGNLLEDRGDVYPTTLVAGVFDEADMVSLLRPAQEERRYLDPRYFDSAGPSPSVANLPDPLALRIFIEGREVCFQRGKVKNFQQRLHLRQGLYTYRFDFEDREGRCTRIEMSRFCDMLSMRRAYMRYSFEPLNYRGRVLVLSGIDGDIRSNLALDRQFQVEDMGREGPSSCFLHARTLARGILVRMRVCTAVLGENGEEWEWMAEDRSVYRSLVLNVEPNHRVVLEKSIAIATSEDSAHWAERSLEEDLAEAVRTGFNRALEDQGSFWKEAWGRAGVEIRGDELAQLYLRFCLYHLLSAAPRHTERLSVPCKLLTGEYYQGTIFYDTDLYIVPFYIFTRPEWARNCLSFRYHGLEAGRAIARELGFQGAKFAWQAGPRGEEALGRWWRFPRTNVHINGDVAYTLMLYFRATQDRDFMLRKGVDILVESARFYVSRLEYDGEWDQYDLRDVAGPDEGHCESTNNFYTNYLVSCTLRDAAEFLERIRREDPGEFSHISSRLHLEEGEPSEWKEAAGKITLLYHEDTGLYEQCENFFHLPPPPENLLEDRKSWFVTVAPFQAMNQPDVVMAMVLYRHRFPEEVKHANWKYYKDKSMNFSSMSFAIHAIMAAEMGEMKEAYQDFLVSAGEDLDEELTGRKDTAQGIHGTACGGAWMAAVFGFGGVWLSDEGLSIRPNLPGKWRSLRFRLFVQGEELEILITRKFVEVKAGKRADLNLNASIGGRSVSLRSGEEIKVPYS